MPGTDAGHHMSDDAGTGGRWMTYDELAAMRGIKRIGAVRLVQRYKWRRQAGNDGRARVLVPHDALQPVRGTDAGTSAPEPIAPTSAGSAAENDAGTLLAGALAALEGAVAGLREQLDAANGRAERAESAVATDRAEVAAERAKADALRERVDDLQAGQELMMDMHARALAAAQDQLSRVREAAEGLRQAEEVRRARGLLARLRAAVRGV
jgi:hypothetical protein